LSTTIKNLVASLKDLLIAENYEIETAYLGQDALQLLQNFAFDLVILDWGLPDLSGIGHAQRDLEGQVVPHRLSS
jgi:DNA-binding response OmpR family regulator